MSLTWREALKKFNDERSANGGGKYTIPKIGTPEYAQVKALQNAPLQKNITAERSKSKTPPKEKKLEVLTPEQAEATMGKKKKAQETSIADVPLEAEAAPKSKSKGKSKKPEAPLPPEAQEGIVKFDEFFKP